MLDPLTRRLLAAPGRVPGYLDACRRVRAGELAIVMYHGVAERPPVVFNWCQIHVEEFSRQIEFLAERYEVLHLDDVAGRMARRQPLPRRTACVTFDDGFRNVATTAWPILERRQVPSTVFLVTNDVSSQQPAWPDRLYWSVVCSTLGEVRFRDVRYSLDTTDDRAASYRALAEQLKRMDSAEREREWERLWRQLGGQTVPPDAMVATLSWEEVDGLARTGLVRFGSHTHTHPILSRCPADVQRHELQASRDALRERGLSADLFAYPNGRAEDFGVETKALLRELGYRCAVCTIPGLNRQSADLFELKRINVAADTTLRQFELRMVGL